jgi:hypothetical protein
MARTPQKVLNIHAEPVRNAGVVQPNLKGPWNMPDKSFVKLNGKIHVVTKDGATTTVTPLTPAQEPVVKQALKDAAESLKDKLHANPATSPLGSMVHVPLVEVFPPE